MHRIVWIALLGLVAVPPTASSVFAQATPYIGFVYPAGGQVGTTFQVKLGGQRIDGVHDAIVTGEGVTAKLIRYDRKLNNQEMQLLREQLKILKPNSTALPRRRPNRKVKAAAKPKAKEKVKPVDKATQELIARLERRITNWVNQPACVALSSIAIIEVTIAPDAEPGAREIRLVTPRGTTNPMAFHVGQFPETTRKAMQTCRIQVLGKEALGLRKRPPDEEEERVILPCTMNGQIASGEVNRYRFVAKKGQRLVASVEARGLVPYIADAVPGWFQPVLTLQDASGKEVAFSDDYRFKPDPTLLFEVPEDGQYVLTINDAIYRGREDFVYRITLAEMPFVTSISPLGGRVGEPATVKMEGWNLQTTELSLPGKDAKAGIHQVAARQAGRDGLISNTVPFSLDTLPECFDEESNDDQEGAQQVVLPVIVNGRIDRTDDWDVFRFEGKAGQMIVAEVLARRLDSPVDSLLKLTDASGRMLAINDDHEDVGSGLSTHHADSYLRIELPENGTYFVHLGDTTRSGGTEYGYRLRISEPRPDFALRVVPSSAVMRSKGGAGLSVYAIRKDGFDGDITLTMKDLPDGFVSWKKVLPKGQEMVRFGLKTDLKRTEQPVELVIEGRATVGKQTIVHEAVAAEDRMQAFLWRHLVPAENLLAVVFDPNYEPPGRRVLSEPETDMNAKNSPGGVAKPAVTKKQAAFRLRQLKRLFEEWLITERFYHRKVAEFEAALK